MLNLRNVYPPGLTRSVLKCGSTKYIHGTSSSKPQLPVTLPVIIVRGKEYAGIWTFDFSKRLWMKLVNMVLEASAFTCSESQPYTQGFLIASPTLNDAINLTLYCSPLTGLNSMNASTTCKEVVWIKSYGPGDRNQNGRQRRLRNLKHGKPLPSALSKKSRRQKSRKNINNGQE